MSKLKHVFRFYLLGDGTTIEFVKDREYLGTVQDIFLNGDYCAAGSKDIFYSIKVVLKND